MSYLHFTERITVGRGIVAKGWPTKFQPPSDFTTEVELDLLETALMNGDAKFVKLSAIEWAEAKADWAKEKSKQRADAQLAEQNGAATTPLPDADIATPPPDADIAPPPPDFDITMPPPDANFPSRASSFPPIDPQLLAGPTNAPPDVGLMLINPASPPRFPSQLPDFIRPPQDGHLFSLPTQTARSSTPSSTSSTGGSKSTPDSPTTKKPRKTKSLSAAKGAAKAVKEAKKASELREKAKKREARDAKRDARETEKTEKATARLAKTAAREDEKKKKEERAAAKETARLSKEAEETRKAAARKDRPKPPAPKRRRLVGPQDSSAGTDALQTGFAFGADPPSRLLDGFADVSTINTCLSCL